MKFAEVCGLDLESLPLLVGGDGGAVTRQHQSCSVCVCVCTHAHT